MIGRLTVVALSLALLAGCGGGEPDAPVSSAPRPSSTEPVADAAFTVDQLKAELPKVGDVPGAAKILATCPGEVTRCEQYPDGLSVLEVRIEPASVEGAAQVENLATPLDFVSVQGQAYPDASSAEASLDAFGTTSAQYVGDYAIAQNGGTSRGTGEVGTLTIGRWRGVTSARTEVSSDSPGDQGLLVAALSVVSGTNRVGIFAGLSAAGRDPQAAAELAESLARQYISRVEAA